MAETIPAARVEALRQLLATNRGYTMVATTRRDGSVQCSLVNAGLMAHPVSGALTLAFVARGGTIKLANLRRRPRATVTVHVGGRWAAVEGHADLCGPDDALPGFDPAALPALLRQVFTAAGGTHDDWPTFDRVMAEERRTAVFVHLERLYSNRL